MAFVADPQAELLQVEQKRREKLSASNLQPGALMSEQIFAQGS